MSIPDPPILLDIIIIQMHNNTIKRNEQKLK